MSNSSLLLEAAEGGVDPMEKLVPALLQIFLTVGLGWATGAMGVLSPQEARGLGMFVGKFSLPALILTSLIQFDLSTIKWPFLLAILISKTIIFFLVLVVEVLLTRDVSRAAIFAIYSTQTNDFGMGLPILNTVYGPQHHITRLVFLVAPINLLCLNPIGFVLLELGRDKREKSGCLATGLAVLRGLVTNPVVVMTVLGVLGNLAFSSSPPQHLDKFFTTLGAAFSALAPFSLGLSMAGKLGGIRGDSIKPILALVILKSIVSPMVMYLMVDQVTMWLDGTTDPSISNFALLLGSMPSALGVASYSVQFHASIDLISAAIVLGTLASAPMLYSIANILTVLTQTKEALHMFEHQCIVIYSILSIVAAPLVLIIMTRKGWRRTPQLLTTSLLLLTLLSSTTALANSFLPHPALALLHLTGLHASRLATPCLALHLLLLTKGGPTTCSCGTTTTLLLAGPLLSLSTLMLLLSPFTPSSQFWQFGHMQVVVSLLVHLASLLPTLACLLRLPATLHSSHTGLQVYRHTLLLVILSTAMFASITLACWKLLHTTSTFPGAFKVLSSMTMFLSMGQGIVFLAVFGLDQAWGLATALLAPLTHLAARLLTVSWGAVGAIFDEFVLKTPSMVKLPQTTEPITEKEERQPERKDSTIVQSL